MKKGFTLVELLAVIVILGLLMTIAIPAVLNVSANVKKKSYETKIQMIENAGVSYGESHLKDFFVSQMKKYQTPPRGDSTGVSPWISINKDTGEITEDNDNGDYPSRKLFVEDLVKYDELSYDATDRCKGNTSCISAGKYNNVILNPVTDNIINKCYVYVYYKNNRVYAKFDKIHCDIVGTDLGKEYPDNI